MPWSAADALNLPVIRDNAANRAKVERLVPRYPSSSIAAKPEAMPANPFLAELPNLPPRRHGHRRETFLQRQIVRALRQAGCPCHAVNAEVALGGERGRSLQAWRNAVGHVAGFPEVLVILRGMRPGIGLLEVKTPPQAQQTLAGMAKPCAGRLSKSQRSVHAWLGSMGIQVATVRSPEEAVETVLAWEQAL